MVNNVQLITVQTTCFHCMGKGLERPLRKYETIGDTDIKLVIADNIVEDIPWQWSTR